MRSPIFSVMFLFFCSGCSSDNGEVVDLYDIDVGEEIVVVLSLIHILSCRRLITCRSSRSTYH